MQAYRIGEPQRSYPALLTIRRGILSATTSITWCDEAIALIQAHYLPQN
ncbi:MAG: hypothetical protein PUP93_18925 [Rhizonema sp. NSF051]|nr:hypothetical protein [Rhizonema sp. NSF051]